MTERAKSIEAWAIKTRGTLNVLNLSDDRDDLIQQINRPAGQSVVRVRISEIIQKGRKR